MIINFKLKCETKSCYRFESGEKPDYVTLYLKKSAVDTAGIDPDKGITVTIEESKAE